MDELTQYLALRDGVTQPLRNMAAAASRLYEAQENASSAAAALESQMNSLGASVSTSGGFFSRASDALKGMAGQFAVGNIAASALMKAADFVTQLPGKIMAASDAYAGMMARLNLVTGSEQEAAQMSEQIYQSALRARGSYDGMADSISKIAMTAKAAFPDPREVVPFVEGIQKLFTIGGTGVQQQADAMLQLTQALGSGKLQGDEFRSIAEAAPLIEQMVAKQMGIAQGELKQLSSQGVITADVLRDAILENMDEINADFAKMPLTWEQAFQQMGTVASHGMQPAYDAVKRVANGPWLQKLMNGFSVVMPVVGQNTADAINGMMALAQTASSVGSYIGEWLTAGFILLGNVSDVVFPALFAALTTYAAYLAVVNYQTAIEGMQTEWAAVKKWAHAAATAAQSAATSKLSVAQAILNAVMNANPIAKVIGLVILIIGAFVAWEMATNGLRNTIAAAFRFIADTAEGVINFVIDKINWLIRGINALAQGLSSITGAHISTIGTIEWKAEGWGDKAYDAVQNFDMSKLMTGLVMPAAPAVEDYPYGGASAAAADMGIGEGPAAKETASNTKGILDAMDIMDEDIKFFRDAAEQEVINRYTTARVEINVENTNNIASDVDADGMIAHLIDQLAEAELAGAEAVHI